MLKQTLLNCILFFTLTLSAQFSNYPQPKIDISKIDLSKVNLSFLNYNQFSFGFKISPSISWLNISHNDMISDGATLKIGIGGVAEYSINPFISIVSGVNYSSFGGYVSDNICINDLSTKENFKLNYSQLEIPIGIKLSTIENKKNSYYLKAGIADGFILTGNEKHVDALTSKYLPAIDIYSNYNFTNYNLLSFNVSIGTEYNLNKFLKLVSEISFNNSITNLANDNYSAISYPTISSPVRYFTNPIIQPGSMQFSLGLMFK